MYRLQKYNMAAMLNITYQEENRTTKIQFDYDFMGRQGTEDFDDKEVNTSLSFLNWKIRPQNALYTETDKDVFERVLFNVIGDYKYQRIDRTAACDIIIEAESEIAESKRVEYFKFCCEYLRNNLEFGNKLFVIAYVHMDENTPHMHYITITAIPDEQGEMELNGNSAVKSIKDTIKKLFGVLQTKKEFSVMSAPIENQNETLEEVKRFLIEERKKSEALLVANKEISAELQGIKKSNDKLSEMNVLYMADLKKEQEHNAVLSKENYHYKWEIEFLKGLDLHKAIQDSKDLVKELHGKIWRISSQFTDIERELSDLDEACTPNLKNQEKNLPSEYDENDLMKSFEKFQQEIENLTSEGKEIQSEINEIQDNEIQDDLEIALQLQKQQFLSMNAISFWKEKRRMKRVKEKAEESSGNETNDDCDDDDL